MGKINATVVGEPMKYDEMSDFGRRLKNLVDGWNAPRDKCTLILERVNIYRTQCDMYKLSVCSGPGRRIGQNVFVDSYASVAILSNTNIGGKLNEESLRQYLPPDQVVKLLSDLIKLSRGTMKSSCEVLLEETMQHIKSADASPQLSF